MNSWEPHGHCFLWQPWILIPDIVTNLVIAISYISLFYSLTIITKFTSSKINKKLEIDEKLISYTLRSFAAFIFWCGMTHLMDITVIWTTAYVIQIIIQAITGAFSSTTAFFLWKITNAMSKAMKVDKSS